MSEYFKYGYLDPESEVAARGEPGPPGIGFHLDKDGNYDVKLKKITNLKTPDNDSDCSNKKYVDDKGDDLIEELMKPITTCLRLNSNDQFDAMNKCITNVRNPTEEAHAVTKKYNDLEIAKINTKVEGTLQTSRSYVDKELKKISEKVLMSKPNTSYISVGKRLTSVSDPIELDSAATKKYVDSNKFDYDCKNNKLINLANPTEKTDSANKLYVDSHLNKLDVPFSATCKNLITLHTEELTIPFDQFSGGTNNIYVTGQNTLKFRGDKRLLFELFVMVHEPDNSYLHLTLTGNSSLRKRLLVNSERVAYFYDSINFKKGEELTLKLSSETWTTAWVLLRISSVSLDYMYRKKIYEDRLSLENISLQIEEGVGTFNREITEKLENLVLMLNETSSRVNTNDQIFLDHKANILKIIETTADRIKRIDNDCRENEKNIESNVREIRTINVFVQNTGNFIRALNDDVLSIQRRLEEIEKTVGVR